MISPVLKTNRIKYIAKLAIVIFWMLAIFLLSNEPASESSRRSGRVVDLLSDYVSSGTDSVSMFLVRKSAHIFMFFVLGILLYVLMRSFAVSPKKQVIFSIVFAFCYAIFDEIHQTFVPGRSGEARDVVIDTLGASVGVLVSYVVIRRVASRAKSKVENVDLSAPTD